MSLTLMPPSVTSMKPLLRWCLALACCVFALTGQAATAESASEPAATRQIESFHDALMASARLDGGYDERIALLGDAFDQVFDLQRIARISAGASWRQLDDATKAEYLDALREVLLGTYVARFDADRGQKLEVLEAKEVKPGRDLVRAQIVRPTGAVVSLDYYLRDNRVFNIEADGVSDLSIRRADYASIIKAEGFSALLDQLRMQASTSRSDFLAARQ